MNNRRAEARTRGQQHGVIRLMVSPGDPISERIKPFVFLDFINGPVADGAGFGWHPHSGIATHTNALNADVAYEDTAGQQGLVKATGLEWMRAGGGTWHQGRIHPHGPTVTSFQPPRGHSVAWVFVYRGKALVAGEPLGDELVVLEPGEGDVVIEAIEPSRLLLGSAVLHDHPLVLGSHSMHTSREALARGWRGLRPSGRDSRRRGGSEIWGVGSQELA
jgi:redox-sensitive bicupin YhaK (pirin superfamily)